MYKIFLGMLCLIGLVGCGESSHCSMAYPTDCHTESEWKVISTKNWIFVDCMNQTKIKKLRNVDRMIRACGENPKDFMTIKNY